MPETKKCATPTISFVDGELQFSSETEDVQYQWEIAVDDAQKGTSSKVSLTTTYHVSVYAIKDGYENSDVAAEEIRMGGRDIVDVNGDGVVDVADVVAVVNIILHGEAQSSPEVQARAREYLKAHGFIVP
jgi:hypothetical protein